MSAPTTNPAAEQEPLAYVPGGDDMPAYRWAVSLYVLMFLLTICVGLLNFLGMRLK